MQKPLRSYRQPLGALMFILMAFWQIAAPLSAATLYWDSDATASGNNLDGTGLGGSGTWDNTTSNWWDLTNAVAWPNTNADIAIFTGSFAALPTLSAIALASGGVTANQLRFERSGYTIVADTLNLAGASAGIDANLGESVIINSLVAGADGLTLNGGGWVRLGNNGNTYTGATTLNHGALVITNPGALGADSSPVVVTRINPAATSTGLRGFGGGSLVLDGTSGSINLSRNLILNGNGPWSDRGAAVVSTGVNTLSGTVDTGGLVNGALVNSRIIAADGTLNLTGTLNVQGTAGTTITNLGGVNQAGASFYNVTGILTGTGTLEGSGGGTLFLNPSDSSGFSGVIRVSGSAASGQSVVRIDSPGVLGTRTSGTTGAVLDLNGGVLAVLMDSPDVKVSNGSNANVYGRASSTIFADHTPNSSVRDQTVAFGNLSYEDGITLTFNSRNGYGMSFTTAPVNGGNGDSTMTNNLQGGALLTFSGNFWSNTDNGANRTMNIGGNGNTLISGNILASAAAFNHNLTKTGSGTLTITSTGSTLDGTVNVNGGTVAINDWRSITNNTSIVDIGTSGTGGTLAVIGNNVSQANLTTSKVINLGGTTGGATILANQTGTSPGLILNANWTATAGSSTNNKTVTLGGTNTAANTINGVIPNNNAGGLVSVTKIDPGTWVLAGANTYTGNTTIANGTLRVKANAAASTIIADTSNLVFNTVNVYAGGTFEFVGQAGANNVESLGALTPTTGSGTIKLTPGSGGTASIIFASLGTVGGGGTVNIVAPTSSDTVSFTSISTTNNIANAGLYYNGSDFAFVPGAGLAVRAPVYGTDVDFATSATALTAGQSNEITGSFSNAAVTIDSLKINGAQTLTMTGLLTVRTAGAANVSGGIIQTGGSGTIAGTGVSTGGSGALIINVDGGANSLQLNAPITATSTGGFTKVGAGTLRLGGTNAQTGTISINEGIVRLAGADRLGAAAALTIRQDGILELNGVTPATNTNAFNNNGIVRNTSATTDVVFTVGGGNGTGDSRGIIEDGGAGKISVVKIGTGAQNWLGLSTYTGTTTIGSTGIVGINNLENGGLASGIGASGSAAGNLIFNGTSTTQAYGGLSYTGTTNDETDRLFTFDGGANGGARIQSNGVNAATSSWTNTGALAFGSNATNNPQGLVLGGGSSGDNRFFPTITDNPAGSGAATSVYKADAGVWYLMGTNTYSGATELRGGALYVVDGVSLPTASNLVLNGGVLATTGAFNRTIGTGSSQMRFAAPAANTAAFRGGFAAGGSQLTVDWGSGNVWGSTANFLNSRDGLIFGAANGQTSVTKSDVELVSDFSLGTASGAAFGPGLSFTLAQNSATVTVTSTAGLIVGQSFTGTNVPSGAYIVSVNSATQFSMSANTANTSGIAGNYADGEIIASSLRPIRVDDNTSIGADFVTLSGDITGNAGTGIRKLGAGILVLSGDNTYDGETSVYQGTLVVSSLGDSSIPGATSVGDSTNGATTAAITLGNGGTGGGILEYVGLGETSDRKIRLNSTTGTNQIHGDGVGSLILTNVANDMTAGAKTLTLRGVSSAANFITSQLSNNGGNLSITVDGSTAWVLTNAANDYSGTTTVGAGALGVGDNSALGTGNLDLSNGSFFAYGADRTIGNVVRGVNNATTGIIGDYSLNFTNPLAILAAANNYALTNNVVAGKSVTFAGVTANSLPGNANRVWTIDGSGLTIINGDFTTTQTAAGGLNLTKTGDGVLVLGGSGGDTNNFNRNNAGIDIDRGTLRLGASEVIGHGVDTQTTPVAYGSVTLSPELAGGDTAILDLNGFNETINGLTMNTDGTAIIDNTAATAASLTFGANNAAVSIGGGIGTYTIQNSGGGALSITKTGTAAAVIPTGVNLNHTGATTVNGGSMTIASPVNGTTALNVINSGSTLALTGGISSPSAVTSIVVENGGTLSLLDGAGNKLNSLTNLQLGSTGGTLTTLNLNVGDLSSAGDGLSTDTLTLLTGGTLSLFAGNQITFNLTDIGLNPNQQYVLLDATAITGGLLGGPLNIGDYILGGTPGGFTSIDLTSNSTTNQIILTTGNLITGKSWWNANGTLDTWNDVANWSVDLTPPAPSGGKDGTNPAVSTPGQGTDVIFIADNITGGAAISTTLEQNFKINSLTFEASSTPANTPSSVTIAPGTVSNNRLEVAPQLVADGVAITTGGPSSVTISAPFKIGANQTWTLADSSSVLILSGGLQGEANVTKAGAGRVVLGAAADPTFNIGATSSFTINAGTLEITDVSALGNPINSNLAAVLVNTTGVFYYNGVASTATNLAMPITLAGGTLSAGTAAQNYSGAVNISGNSLINMAENNGPGTNTARSITLSGVVTGSGGLTVSSNTDALTGGNPEGGTFLISNAASTWSGPLTLTSGTVDIGVAASPAVVPSSVTFDAFGRLIVRGLNGQTYNQAGAMTFTAGTIGEYLLDNTSGTLAADFVVNQNGQVNLGSGGTGASARFTVNDAATILNITGSVILGGNSSISVDGGDANSFVTISGVISDGGSGYSLAINDDAGGWAASNDIIRLTGLNTFTGNISLTEGILEFDTVTDISGGASSLGNGTDISMAGGTLRFVGSSAQTTNRPISTTGAMTLSANGATAADTITYSGAITVGPTADGSQITLAGAADRVGIIDGGITQTGDTADMTVNGGTWIHQTGTSRIGDDLTITGASTVLTLDSGLLQVRDDVIITAGATLNLNGSAVLSQSTATLSADAYVILRDGATVNLGDNDAIVVTDFDRLYLAQDTDGATVTLNMNTFNLSTNRMILGERSALRNALINGTGTLTVIGGDIDLYEGTINASLGSTGTTALEKFGPGIVTLAGDNSSSLTSTGSSIIYEGTLIFDYASSNTSKVRAASALDMRGSYLILNGNNTAATSQSVGSFTIGSGGSSRITLNPVAGQEIVLNLNALTRAVNAQDGTLRLVLPAGTQSATNGVTTDTLNTLGVGANAILGGWLTVNDGTGTFFARNLTNAADGNIVAAVTTLQGATASWLTGENISDSAGFTGTLSGISINSLRFHAATGSDLTLSPTGVLGITSGGILVTDNVAGTPSLVNGTLFSGAVASNVPELIFTQESTQTFELGADVRINHALTKSGAGTLRLTGDNVYTGYTEIQQGMLQVTGSSIGDTSLVTLSAARNTTLQLLANETIGRLQGGQRATNSDYGTVDVDTFTLTLNQSANTTYAGFFTGTGAIVMNAGGTGNLNLTNVSTGFTGIVTIDSGLFQLSGIGQINANIIRINKGGNLLIDNTGTTRSGTRILDTTAITMNSADGAFSGQTRPRGLAIRTDQDTTLDETVGLVTLASGANYSALEATTTNDDSDIIMSDLVRINRATLNVRGTNLGSTSAQRNELRIVTANDTAFIAANLVGGGGAAASQNISIVPWAIGETFTAGLGDANMGNSLVTYVSGSGFRPLAFATEYDTISAAAATDNARESLTADLTGLAGTTVNALVIHNNNTADSTVNVTGIGSGQTLAVTSGALLFTLNSAATASTVHSILLGGFDSGITVGSSNEYVIHVVNPSSAATTPTLSATIASPLTSNADITKSGRGTLVFTAVNTAGGGANKTTLNEGVLEIADLDNIGGDTGSLVFAGGTLRLDPSFTDDLSLRTITLLDGGGTLDTNGIIEIALAGSLGSGLGGFTKTGGGNLTLNAAATFTGGTTVAGGSLTVGANNATGIGGNLSIAAGATLDLGSNSITHALVTTSGAGPLITGTGTITASTGFFFNHTGDTLIEATLAGAGGLLKAQTNVVTLSGASTYAGTTEIQAGTLSINSLTSVGGGASALGNAPDAETGIIRMGLTTAATVLQYTGAGHASDRLIGMQGTTGGVTLDADGTGAFGLGGVRFEMGGNKTLTLRGSSDAGLDNTLGAITEIGGVLTLNKSDSNTWLLATVNSYTGVTQIDNGTLKVGVNDALPTSTTVRLGTGTTAGALDLNGFDQTIGSLLVQTNSDAVVNQIVVDSGNTLTINGAVSIGAAVEDGNTNLNALGGGAIVVNSGNANFIVGTATGASNSRVDVDFTGLSSFTANLGTGFFRLGDPNTDTEDNPSTFKLAVNNTITAAQIRIGDGSGGGVPTTHTLTLGSGANLFNADTFNIGSAAATTRSGGAVVFDAGDTTGTLTVRASNGTDRATVNLINTTGSTAGSMSAALDVTGHTADILASTLTMASRSQNSGAGAATLNFDQGTLDVTTLNMASRTGTGTGDAIATVNLGDSAAPGTPTTTIGTLNMAVNTSAGGTVTADLNVTGGSVIIGTGSGTAVSMANAGAGQTVTSTIDLTGGTVTVTGNVVRTGGAGTENATVTLDGATLNMSGNSIGTGTAAIIFAAQSGTLAGLAELNGGGSLSKTTAGTLTLTDSNTYTGGTTIVAGTVLANNTTGSATGSGAVTVEAAGTLAGTGAVVAGAGNNITIDGTLSTGLSGAVAGEDLALSVSGAGNLALNGTVAFDIFANAQTGTLNSAASNDLAVISAADWSNVIFGGSSILLVTTALDTSTWVSGDSWQLIDWSGVAGGTAPTSGFATFDLPSLTGLAWDTSALYTTGVIVVGVPEPSRMLLLLTGLLGLMLRRRRR